MYWSISPAFSEENISNLISCCYLPWWKHWASTSRIPSVILSDHEIPFQRLSGRQCPHIQTLHSVQQKLLGNCGPKLGLLQIIKVHLKSVSLRWGIRNNFHLNKPFCERYIDYYQNYYSKHYLLLSFTLKCSFWYNWLHSSFKSYFHVAGASLDFRELVFLLCPWATIFQQELSKCSIFFSFFYKTLLSITSKLGPTRQENNLYC